jgi:hypothetical protein
VVQYRLVVFKIVPVFVVGVIHVQIDVTQILNIVGCRLLLDFFNGNLLWLFGSLRWYGWSTYLSEKYVVSWHDHWLFLANHLGYGINNLLLYCLLWLELLQASTDC